MDTPFTRNDVKHTPTSTEDSAERGFVKEDRRRADPTTYRDLGQSETLDREEEGDIADEGKGHRG